MEFKDPWILLLIPVCLGVVYYFYRANTQPTLRFSSVDSFSKIGNSWKVLVSERMIFLRLIVLALFLISLAGPRKVLEKTETSAEGIDIVLAVDASGSMAAEDFRINNRRVNRLEVVKNVVEEFIDQRKADRIGLVVFAAHAFTVCPVTTDHEWLKSNLERVELGSLGQDGTAIGSSISSAVGRLKTSKAKSKVVILLTDGVNNAGTIDPLTAAKAAKTFGIKIYTIGAGSKDLVPFPAQDLWGRTVYQNVQIDMDEALLKRIAQETGAEYFRATDTESLKEIYQQIDRLEKTKIEQFGYKEYKELFPYFFVAALLLLLAELVLTHTVLMRIP
ncbi:MAG: hypothetical protein A2Z88_10065 [Omnitrophica WOR_2 bacterium GWA2_47_8]|nr:MAG: hypothetical protein A2Z88_10065 [Omnitrophica WOR_2 bacterium GWA2_47_8]